MRKKYLLYLLFSVLIHIDGFAQIQSGIELSGKSSFIRGMEAFNNKEFGTARTLLLQAYDELGEKPGISYALADTYLMLDDLPNAALYGKEAVNAEPENKWFRIKLARVYRSAGQNQATLNELETLLNYYPNDFDALYMLADTYKDYGQFVKSNQILNRILKLTGPSVQVHLLKFRNFETLEVPDSALAQLEIISEIDPDNLEVLNLLGDYYNKSGLGNEAKNVLGNALDRNARDPQSLINLAGIYFQEQKWDSAGTLLENFVSDSLIAPEEKMAIAQFLYSKTLESPKNIQLQIETERILESFTASEPSYGPAFTLSGQFFAQSGKNEKALEMLSSANKLLPEDDIAWRQRLQLLLNENKLDETIEVGKKADENVPDDTFIQFFVGSAYMLKGENAEAENWLKNAARAPARRPFKSIVYGTLGDVQANLEKHQNSDQAYETALKYDPENHNAMNNYAYNLSVRGEKLEQAKELSLKAIQLAPDNPSYLDTVGWVYYKLQDYDRARRFIKASIDTGAASAVVLEHLGDVYNKLGDIDEAKKWWKEAYEKDSSKTYLEEKIQ